MKLSDARIYELMPDKSGKEWTSEVWTVSDLNRFARAIESALAGARSEPTVHQALLDSLSALLDRQEAMPQGKRQLSLDERDSVEAAIGILSKLRRRTA